MRSMRVSVSRLGGERFGLWRDAAIRRGVAALFTIIFIVFTNTLVGGCAIKLAPDFDKAIFDGLTKANEDAMKIFASVPSKPYNSAREKAYDDVVGELNAVQVQVNARTTPPAPPPLISDVVRAVGSAAAEKKLAELSEPPTSSDIDNLILIMETAKYGDKKNKLLRMSRVHNKTRLVVLKNSFSTQMAQALAYEKALQR
jgi:hypothetical protein